jgi:hypothetical protein
MQPPICRQVLGQYRSRTNTVSFGGLVSSTTFTSTQNPRNSG